MKRYYIQSALTLPDEEMTSQKLRPLLGVKYLSRKLLSVAYRHLLINQLQIALNCGKSQSPHVWLAAEVGIGR